MNRIHILPAAFAAALLVAGSASQAFAAHNTRWDDHSYIPWMNSQTTASKATGTQTPWTGASNQVGLNQAEKLATQRVGGTVIDSDHFGPGFGMYKFDIRNGNQVKRVYVNGRTGMLTVASNLSASFDPSVIGGDANPKPDGDYAG